MTTQRLSGLDASFLYLETPTTHMHVAFTAILDPSTVPGGYSFRRLRRHIHDRIPLAPVFQRRLVEVPLGLGHPLWVDDPDFDIDNHLHRAALPAPGGIQELADFVADVFGRKLDRDHPLWEMWIVEGLEGGKICLVAKMHHATIDGISGAELLGLLLDMEPVRNEQLPVADSPVDSEIPSTVELLGQALLRQLITPFGMVKMAWRTSSALLGIRRVRQDESIAKAALPLTAPRVSINSTVGSRRRVAYAAVSLADAKRLKDALGVTVNDVVLALTTSALRDYLLAGDELPTDPLVAVVPVSVTPDVAELHGSNKVSAMFVPLPTQVAAPLERLRLIHETTKGAKEEHRALGAETLQNWAEHASSNLFGLAARLYTRARLAERHRPLANVVVSNVPGPDFPLYLGGGELEACFPLGPVMDGLGLNVTIMSYRGALYWGLVSCARAVPRLWDLAASIPRALEELLADAGVVTEPLDLPIHLGPGSPKARPATTGGPRQRRGRATVTAIASTKAAKAAGAATASRPRPTRRRSPGPTG